VAGAGGEVKVNGGAGGAETAARGMVVAEPVRGELPERKRGLFEVGSLRRAAAAFALAVAGPGDLGEGKLLSDAAREHVGASPRSVGRGVLMRLISS
jgi:hypothetical protein